MASGATSIWGRPFPLSTDAPAVHTDIQALANSLETVPTYPTTAVTSRTGVSGESVLVSPSQTLTLPASPVKGDRIQILALGTVTGATPVTVAGGGKVINGLGLSSASSFVLGAPNSKATVQYDGTAWRVIDGQQDTGWVALSLATNFVPTAGAYVPSARLRGDVVQLSGDMQNNGAATGSTCATIPVGLRPAASVNAPAINASGSVVAAMFIGTSGNILVQTFASGNTVGLDYVSYRLL